MATKTDKRPIPPDLKQCQVMRPSTWPALPSFMTLGPVSYQQCTNKPHWIGSDGKGEMSLCDECRSVCERLVPGTTFRQIGAKA